MIIKIAKIGTRAYLVSLVFTQGFIDLREESTIIE